MTAAHINRIATAVPPHDVHRAFVRFARTLLADQRSVALFDRMVDKAQISHRYAVLPPSDDPEGASVDGLGVYTRGRFPSTGERMRIYENHAPDLAARAVAGLDLGADVRRVTHLIVTSCTGMVAPGIDHLLIDRCGLDPAVERTMVGFMGCYAAINALKLARHIVRSEPAARVLIVNLELCSMHLQQTANLEQMLSFLVFADGAAASLVSADPVGLAMDRFHAVVVPGTAGLITWKIRDLGFNMFLSGRVPAAIREGLHAGITSILGGTAPADIDRWAVHPGGRSVLDAVEQGLGLDPRALAVSRDVLDAFGNMSSATVMFVLQKVLSAAAPGECGCAMSFGPGLTAETMQFHRV
ncbi:MAG: type III polyketide synthase [Pseudomonadota bacterium]|nr:type III polyketide synthase [Pseudomonadota bacterium]